MDLYLDIKLITKINTSPDAEEEALSLLHSFSDRVNPPSALQDIDVIFKWPTLLEYIELGDLLQDFPLFSQKDQFFNHLLSLLQNGSEKTDLIRAYDQLFAECLTLIKQLPQLDRELILTQIQKKKSLTSSNDFHTIFKRSLDLYEQRLLRHPAEFMHDLILYLAWDRVCVNLAILFEYPNLDLAAGKGLEILIECLVESFQHITDQKRTSPSFFRLMESLYAYYMREENLDNHKETEWAILCEGACSLRSRSALPDVPYVDAAITDKEEEQLIEILTLDSPEKVQKTLSLAQLCIDNLKAGPFPWHYSLSPLKTCLYERDSKV